MNRVDGGSPAALNQLRGIVTMTTTDNDDRVDGFQQFLQCPLAVLGRFTNGIREQYFSLRASDPDLRHERENTLNRLSCLRNDSVAGVMRQLADVSGSTNDKCAGKIFP